MSFSTTGIDNSDTHAATEPSTEASSGAGGGDMGLWQQDRETILNKTYSQVADVSNEANFPLPGGVLAVSGISQGGLNNERSHGIQAKGQTKSADGALAGEAQIIYSPTDAIVHSEDISGPFKLLVAPPTGVATGTDSDPVVTSADLAVGFSPSFAGLNYLDSDLGKYHDIQYSGVEGYVEDVQGRAVSNESILGSGDGVTTDENGYYSLLAPANSSSDLVGLQQTKTKSFTAPSDTKARVDWQFAGIQIRVQTPSYEAIPGVPVEIDGVEFETGEDGTVVFPTAGLGEDHTVRVYDNDDLTDTITAPSTEGRLTDVVVGPEESSFGSDPDGTLGPFSVSLTCLDETSNQPIRGISCTEIDHVIRATTNEKGKTKLVIQSDDDGTADILVGNKSDRYRPTRIQPDMVEGETVEETVTLTPTDKITNY